MISFHLRQTLLKSFENSLKYSTFCIVSGQNALQSLNECIKTFNMSYEPYLYDLFHLILILALLILIIQQEHFWNNILNWNKKGLTETKRGTLKALSIDFNRRATATPNNRLILLRNTLDLLHSRMKHSQINPMGEK